LYDNQISDGGAIAIAEALKSNVTINTLWLSGNQIGDAGTEAIAEALKTNITLKDLHL